MKYTIRNGIRTGRTGKKEMPVQVYGFWEVPVKRFEFSVRYEDNRNIYNGNENFLRMSENTAPLNDGKMIRAVIEGEKLNSVIIYSNLVINRNDIASVENKAYNAEPEKRQNDNKNILNPKTASEKERKIANILFLILFPGSLPGILLLFLRRAKDLGTSYGSSYSRSSSGSINISSYGSGTTYENDLSGSSYSDFNSSNYNSDGSYSENNDYSSSHSDYSDYSSYDDYSSSYDSFSYNSTDYSSFDSGGGGGRW